MDDYEKELNDKMNEAGNRVIQGMAAGNFLKTAEGRLIQDWIDERVSYLVSQLTGKNPLSDREYLAAHGAVRELMDFNLMLQSKQRAGENAQEELKVLNEQSAAVSGQEHIKF